MVACIDNVRDILDVAISVLRDHGRAPGDSRLERMARWLIMNLGVQLQDEHARWMSRVYTSDSDLAASHVGDHVGLSARIATYEFVAQALEPEKARQLATALLICAERAEEI